MYWVPIIACWSLLLDSVFARSWRTSYSTRGLNPDEDSYWWRNLSRPSHPLSKTWDSDVELGANFTVIANNTAISREHILYNLFAHVQKTYANPIYIDIVYKYFDFFRKIKPFMVENYHSVLSNLYRNWPDFPCQYYLDFVGKYNTTYAAPCYYDVGCWDFDAVIGPALDHDFTGNESTNVLYILNVTNMLTAFGGTFPFITPLRSVPDTTWLVITDDADAPPSENFTACGIKPITSAGYQRTVSNWFVISPEEDREFWSWRFRIQDSVAKWPEYHRFFSPPFEFDAAFLEELIEGYRFRTSLLSHYKLSDAYRNINGYQCDEQVFTTHDGFMFYSWEGHLNETDCLNYTSLIKLHLIYYIPEVAHHNATKFPASMDDAYFEKWYDRMISMYPGSKVDTLLYGNPHDFCPTECRYTRPADPREDFVQKARRLTNQGSLMAPTRIPPYRDLPLCYEQLVRDDDDEYIPVVIFFTFDKPLFADLPSDDVEFGLDLRCGIDTMGSFKKKLMNTHLLHPAIIFVADEAHKDFWFHEMVTYEDHVGMWPFTAANVREKMDLIPANMRHFMCINPDSLLWDGRYAPYLGSTKLLWLEYYFDRRKRKVYRNLEFDVSDPTINPRRLVDLHLAPEVIKMVPAWF